MENIKITPSLLSGEIEVPPSKSMSHRAIICAALAKEESIIDNVILSEDIIATIEAMRYLGAEINVYTCSGHCHLKDITNIENEKSINKYTLVIKGTPYPKLIKNEIFCGESGSTIRFLIPVALLTQEEVTFTGKGKLIERPLDTYYKIFEEQGIKYRNVCGKLPLRVKGSLKPGEYRVKGNISSQFISGLLFALPLLLEDSRIIITTELESIGYIDLTIEMLNRFGIVIENKDYKEFYIKGNQKYKASNYRVEGDFSQGAFFLVASAIGNKLKCKDLDLESLQGDKVILDVIEKMGGEIHINENQIMVKPSNTRGISIDASQCPDLVPIMTVLASLSEGVTRIEKAERLRIKESDRLKAISEELNKLGAEIKETPDGLIIRGKSSLKGGRVKSWNDHRIAMAIAIAATRCENEVVIEDSGAVKKSYPSFWEDYSKLGGVICECSDR